jgi:hypothetical protein
VRLDRLRGGELLAGAGGLVLAVALFLPWFGKVNPFCVSYPGYSCGRNFHALQAFDFTDVVLVLTAVAGIAVAVLAGTSAKTDFQITSASMTVPLALLATLLVAYRVLEPVGKLDLRAGLFVGLAACTAVTCGSWRAVRDEGPSRVFRSGRPRSASQTRRSSASGSPRPRSGKERRRQRRERRRR